MDKRTFLKGMGLAGLGATLSGRTLAASFPGEVMSTTAAAGAIPGALSRGELAEWIGRFEQYTAAELADNEDFWAGVRGGYQLTPEYINLENGYYNILPTAILDAFIHHVRDVNYEGSHYMRTVQFDNKKTMTARLAALAGCSPEELIITRNTTESLDTIIGGYPWKTGDEAIMAQQDYPAMLGMFRQAERRHGVALKIVSVPNHPASDEELVELYAKAITPKTRLLMVCHMINITGQILPVRKICDMAHARGVEVMVDGAHSFAHIRHSVPDLHCDYYGASLHKWLSVPLGAGLLYVRKEHIGKIWPLLQDPDDQIAGIARLNHTGTLPVHTDLSIADAIDFYNMLRADRKEARLRYLQEYWTTKVRDLPGVMVNTPADPARACGIANVGLKKMPPAELAEKLFRQYKIYTVAIDYPAADVRGCRITPNVFTTPAELDTLVRALNELSS